MNQESKQIFDKKEDLRFSKILFRYKITLNFKKNFAMKSFFLLMHS